MKRYTTVEQQIEFGLDSIDEDETVKISLRDLMYVFQTMGEINRFFHQKMHYTELSDVEKFLGTKKSGAYAAIHHCYYKILRNSLPEHIESAFGEGERFNHPDPPYYYKPKAETR
ncbi:MAG: hypothetical protein RL693_2451 [Verrucomicrobiota bacterium]|jgi:uncharacterized protein (UPF0262 family)